MHLPQTRVWKILNRRNYKPYKIHVSHRLLPGDLQRRLTWCHWLREQVNLRENFLNNVIWSDETKFTNCGMFNRNNEHFWSRENPRQNRQIRNQVRFGLNVWAGLLDNNIIGPFIYAENLNGAAYLQFLQTEFTNYLENLPLARLPFIWFQQDGAPPHNLRAVTDFLHAEFPQQWIGNRGVVQWPARSPDLSPLDFFLWGTLKNMVYKETVETVEELRVSILNAFASLRRRDINRAIHNINRRINLCIEEEGNIFEHLL